MSRKILPYSNCQKVLIFKPIHLPLQFDMKAKKANFFATYRGCVDEPISWESLEEFHSVFKEKGKLPIPTVSY